MALIRSPKSGSEWTTNELLAYNITVQLQNHADFFDGALGSIDNLDPTVAPHFSQETYRFLAYLDLASRANAGRRAAIHDLARSVLEVSGFDKPGTILRSRYEIPFTICGDSHKSARTDLCLVHTNSTILLVIQDKTTFSSPDPEAQVIAEAIATFQHNNRKRVELGLPALDAMAIPCITMLGTRPVFYKVPVTKQLSDCVVSGQYPPHSTVVSRCSPPARDRVLEGMEVPDYRRVALQYYDAFHVLARAYWTVFLDGCH